MSAIDVRPDEALPIDPPITALKEVLDRQRGAFLTEGPPPLDVRLERIDRFVACVLEVADELVVALNADFGSRPRLVSLRGDIAPVMPAMSLIRDNLRSWMSDEEVPGSVSAGIPAFVQKRPKGVVGVVGPWNFPVALVVVPAIEALAAGNRVMIKISEVPARTADIFARAVASRMHMDEVAVVRGGADTAAEFSSLPFDHIIFTGSPGVGARVAEAAGRNLVPVTLELGGKNPVVLGSDADLEVAADRIAGVRLMNGGQICLCPDYVFVPRARLGDFVSRYEVAVRSYLPTFAENQSVVSIVDERNFDRVNGLIADAEAKGAEVRRIVPSRELNDLPNRRTRRIPPTVLLDVTPSMTVASEEIFGPVIAVYPYDELDDVISYVNSQPSPLAAYWFGSDGSEFRQFIERTTSGGVTRNDLLLHWSVPGAPSGGVGRSGMGAYSGKVGFLTFSHQRTIAASVGSAGGANHLSSAVDSVVDAVSASIDKTLQEIRMRIPAE